MLLYRGLPRGLPPITPMYVTQPCSKLWKNKKNCFWSWCKHFTTWTMTAWLNIGYFLFCCLWISLSWCVLCCVCLTAVSVFLFFCYVVWFSRLYMVICVIWEGCLWYATVYKIQLEVSCKCCWSIHDGTILGPSCCVSEIGLLMMGLSVLCFCIEDCLEVCPP